MSRPSYFSACLLSAGVAALAIPSLAHSQTASVEAIKPPERSSTIRAATLDGKRFEFGPYVGFLSVEDFNTNIVSGLALNYHISSRFLAQLNYGISSVERATFEDISGGNFLAEADRDFEYQNLLVGFSVLNGRSFLGERRKYNSHLYLMAGASQVSFAGQDTTGMVFGINYKAVLTNWLTVNLDFRDIVVDREFLGETKTTHNTEFTLGFNALF